MVFGEEAKRTGEVRPDSKTLNGILNCASEEDLAKAGRKFGETLPLSYLRAVKRPCDFESCYYLLTSLLGEHNNWYDFKVEETPETIKFILLDTNKLGRKWLIFIEEYAAAMVRSILSVEAKLSTATDSVLLEIPEPKKTA